METAHPQIFNTVNKLLQVKLVINIWLQIPFGLKLFAVKFIHLKRLNTFCSCDICAEEELWSVKFGGFIYVIKRSIISVHTL